MNGDVYNINSSPVDGFGIKDTVALIALFVSLLSIIASLFGIFLVKRMEITMAKFNKLCIAHLDGIMVPLDMIFETKGTMTLGIFRNNVTSFSTEYQLYLVNLKDVNYKHIELNDFIMVLEKFTETFYSRPSVTQVYEFKSEYLNMKLRLHELLYRFALEKELNILEKVIFKR